MKDGHSVETQVHTLHTVRDPLVIREHLLGHSAEQVVGYVDMTDG